MSIQVVIVSSFEKVRVCNQKVESSLLTHGFALLLIVQFQKRAVGHGQGKTFVSQDIY